MSAGGIKRGLTVLKPLLPRLSAVRLAPLLTIAVFVALSVTACSSGHETAGVPVPWVNRPLPRYEVPAPQVIPYPTSAPPCHASELRIAQGRSAAAAGTLYERLVFTNIGRRTCLLRGYPTITALGPDGSRRPLRHHREGFTFFYLVPANLPPRGHSFIGLATGDGCDNGTKPTTSYQQLSVTIPHRETVQAGAGVRITEVCGLFVSSFGLPARYTPLAPVAGTPRPQPFASTCPQGSAPGQSSATRSRSRIPRIRRSRFGPAPATAKASTPQASSSADRSHSTATPSMRSAPTSRSATPCSSPCRPAPQRASPSSAGA